MHKPDADDIHRFLDIMYTAANERSADERAFAREFAQNWLEGKKSKYFMNDAPELWESYILWDADRKKPRANNDTAKRQEIAGKRRNRPAAEADEPEERGEDEPAPPRSGSPESGAYAMLVEDELPHERKKKKKKRNEAEGDEPDAAALEEASEMINSDAPLTQAGMIGLADRMGKTDDDEIGRELDRRESPQRTVNWVRRAANATMLTLAVGGATAGTYFVGKLAKKANDDGQRIQEGQQQLGRDFDNLGANPLAPIESLKGKTGATEIKATDEPKGGAEKLINKSKGKGRAE